MPSSSELAIERRRCMGRPPRRGACSRTAVALRPRTADARLRAAVQSSISQLTTDQERRLSASLDPAWRIALGLELRDRRRGSGLTQGALGAPLTKGFVSAVEHGRTIPSLPALRLMTDRLGIPLGEFLRGVDRRSTTT
jgi:helix-turn-helix protein